MCPVQVSTFRDRLPGKEIGMTDSVAAGRRPLGLYPGHLQPRLYDAAGAGCKAWLICSAHSGKKG